MASKYHLKNSLIYIDGTDIPRNKPGLTDSDELKVRANTITPSLIIKEDLQEAACLHD